MMRENSGCTIDIDQGKDSQQPFTRLTFKGTEAQITVALGMLGDLGVRRAGTPTVRSGTDAGVGAGHSGSALALRVYRVRVT